MATGKRPSFASFWAGGPLSPYEKACLHSFLKYGYEVTLFTFQKTIEGIPDKLAVENASVIVDEKYTKKFCYKGKPSLSHFSDLFRYRLFEKTDMIWIDCDMLLLKEFGSFKFPGTVLAKEHATSLCGAIMRLDNNHPALPRLVARTTELAEKDLIWGDTGPRLLTKVFGSGISAEAFAPEVFFPLHFKFFWKAFLPEYADECAELCRNSYTMHLWNNIVVDLGIWKDFMPPKGSFLSNRFCADGSDGYFRDTYPEDVMRSMVQNWRGRFSGADLPLGPLVRRIVPSVNTFVQKKLGDYRLKFAS